VSGTETTQSDIPKTPTGEGQRWQRELTAGREALKKWHEDGSRVVRVFLDEEDGKDRGGQTRWNLWWSGATMQMAMLLGHIPKTDVSRRFADADDDAGRIAGVMQERLLNTDIERAGDTTVTALQLALWDWRVPGGGLVRLRYVADFAPVETAKPVEGAAPPPQALDEGTGSPVEAPAPVPPQEQLTREDVEVDYVHWRDVLWSPARVWHEVRWMAFAADISREKAVERFGEEIGSVLPTHPKKEKEAPKEPWDRIRVWEIWDKERKRRYMYCEGFPEVLEDIEDPLGLEGFFPCPKPVLKNLSTDKLCPKSDYLMAQDQYRSINNLSTRIEALQDAVKVVGLYDNTAGNALAGLFDGDSINKMIPVPNWAAFAEKGAIQGAVTYLPIDQVVAAMQVLIERRREEVDALYQITGMSDIMRGQASSPGATATEQAAKARFGSVRMQADQDEFARFTSDVQRLKAEIISKHFRPETILQRSNAAAAFSKEPPALVQQAVQLIKSRFSDYRVVVRPESVALTDFAALRSERTEVIGAVSTFVAGAAPVLQMMPDALETMLELLQSMVSGLKGASTMEGTIDRALASVKAAKEAKAAAGPQQQPQDPKVQAEQMKLQGSQMKAAADMQKQQLKHQNDLEKIQAETYAADKQEESQARHNVREAAEKQMVSNALKPKPTPGGMP
jgi:hypothetical protein